MNSRERLTRLFDGREIDRTPIWLLYPWHRLGCYADVYNNPDYASVVRRIEAGDCDSFDRRGIPTGFCYNDNKDIHMSYNNTDTAQETILTAGKLQFTSGVYTKSGAKSVKFFVDDPQQLLSILDILYQPVEPDFSILRKEKAEFGERGLFMLDFGDPLSPLYNLMRADDFALATATDFDIMETFLEEMERRVLDLYRRCLEADAADCYFIVGCEFAGPPLVSPARFKQMSSRYVRGICDLIRSYGRKSILHYHGNLRTILDGVREINPDALHTIEAPPIGDCTLTQARAGLPNAILIGNMQYDDLIRGTTESVLAGVKAILDEATGPFILSPTAGPYEETLSEQSIRNYIAFIDTALRYGSHNRKA